MENAAVGSRRSQAVLGLVPNSSERSVSVAPEPRRPWWKKKRWAAALVLWLLVAYPLSAGPAVYAVARWWLPGQALAVYSPIFALVSLKESQSFGNYLGWWIHRAFLDELSSIRRQAERDAKLTGR
jgi:hypothetical protein